MSLKSVFIAGFALGANLLASGCGRLRLTFTRLISYTSSKKANHGFDDSFSIAEEPSPPALDAQQISENFRSD